MKTKIELEQSIIKITTIKQEYPELSEFIIEMRTMLIVRK
jgi:hypothetical protein